MVEAPIRIGWQLCYSSVANLLQYLCAKNYQNRSITQLHKVIAKNKRVQFFSPQSSIFTILVKDYHLIIFLQIVTKHSKNKMSNYNLQFYNVTAAH